MGRHIVGLNSLTRRQMGIDDEKMSAGPRLFRARRNLIPHLRSQRLIMPDKNECDLRKRNTRKK